MQAWLALRLGVEGLQVIRARRVPPQCTTLSVSRTHTHTHAQTHTFLLSYNLSGKCRSATLLVQIQSNLNTKKAKSYSTIGAEYKNRTELN